MPPAAAPGEFEFLPVGIGITRADESLFESSVAIEITTYALTAITAQNHHFL